MKVFFMVGFLAWTTYQAYKDGGGIWYFFSGWEAAYIAVEMAKG